MALSPEQFNEFIENYADKVLDDMDNKSKDQLLYQLLVDSYSDRNEHEMEELIVATYGEETYNELLESVN